MPLDHVCCASLPPDALAVLACLRGEEGVEVLLARGRAWVRWGAGPGTGTEGILLRVLAVPGVELFARAGGRWHRPGHALPSFDVPWDDPEAEPMPLARAIVPRAVEPTPPDGAPPLPARLSLVRDDRPRPASALRCRLEALAAWAEMATAARLAALSAAWAGERVLMIGRPLPPIAGAERFWGGRVLTPLGFRPEPDLPEPALLAALGAGQGGVIVLGPEGVEDVPGEAFGPVTRAGIRLARAGRTDAP